MSRHYNFWNSRHVCVLIVVIFVQFSNIRGIYSQNIDLPKGPLIHNAKEPPDIRNTDTSEQALSRVGERNSGRARQPFLKKPMNFLCSSRTPMFVSRRNISPQTSSSPFVITVIPEITKDKLVHVKLSSPKGETFRGFLVQVLSSSPDTDGIVTGEFRPSPYVNLQSCYSNNDTATSSDKTKKDSALVTWQAPANLKGNVIVRATVIQDNQKYWSDILSEEIKFVDISPNMENKDTSRNVSKTDGGNTSGAGVSPETSTLKYPKSLKDTEKYDLEKSIAETFEGFNGPLESPNEVLLHQGIRQVNKVEESGQEITKSSPESGIVITSPSLDDPPTAPLPPPRYFYRTMNQFAPDFEPPQRSEFIGQLLQGAMGGGNSAGGGGLGSMMNMMGMASNMFGGGNKGGGGGGGGGLMSSLGTISKLSGMLGGGNRRPPASGGMGGLGSLGALSSLGSMMGGGNRMPSGNTGPAPAGGGLGGLGALSSLLGGLGNKNNQSPVQNVAPPPSGAPVNPPNKDEPSLADLLGVDPSYALDTPTVVPAEANPLAGVTAAKAGGGLMAKIGGFAPMLAVAPIAFSMFGKKKKQQQQMPFGQPGQFGMTGAPGMPPGSQGQFGMPGAQASQFGGQGQFGMPGSQGQFGMPGSQGQFGMPPAQQGQFGGMPGQFGMPPQNMGVFGATQPPATQAPKQDDIRQIIQMLEAQRLQIELLKNQIGGASITSQMGGFGNIPLSFGQTTGSQLLGLTDATGRSNLGNFGTSLSTFEPAGPSRQVTQPPQTSSQDILLQELLKQNQMLMQQNQQFQTNMLAATQNQGQFGATSGGSVGRVNRSNGQMMNNGIPSGTLSQSFTQSNFPPNANNGITNGFLPGSNTFPNTAPLTQGAFGAGGQNNFGNFGNMPGNNGGQSLQNPSSGAASMFGQFGGSNSGQAAGSNVPNVGTMNGGMMNNQGGAASGGNLANMFGGGSGPAGAGISSPPSGGQNGMGGQANTPPIGGGGGAVGGGGGAGNKAPDLGSLMGGIDTSALQGMLGGGAGGGMDMSNLLNNVDVNAMQGLLSGEQGQDLMKSVSGMLSGPNGGNLMQAVSGMMSGESGPADIANLMGSMDMGELQNMAKQAEGIMASSGIDPAQILGMMG